MNHAPGEMRLPKDGRLMRVEPVDSTVYATMVERSKQPKRVALAGASVPWWWHTRRFPRRSPTPPPPRSGDGVDAGRRGEVRAQPDRHLQVIVATRG